jgi:hypothetical protein
VPSKGHLFGPGQLEDVRVSPPSVRGRLHAGASKFLHVRLCVWTWVVTNRLVHCTLNGVLGLTHTQDLSEYLDCLQQDVEIGNVSFSHSILLNLDALKCKDCFTQFCKLGFVRAALDQACLWYGKNVVCCATNLPQESLRMQMYDSVAGSPGTDLTGLWYRA